MCRIKLLRNVLLVLLAFSLNHVECYPIPAFNSQVIMRLFEKLPDSLRIQLSAAQLKAPATLIVNGDMICENTKVNAKYNDHGEMLHLGLHLMSTNYENKSILIVKEYLERLFLTCCLLNNHDAILFHLQYEKVEITINGEPLADLLQHDSFCSAIELVKNAPVSIERSSNGFHAIFSPDLFNHVSIKFPADIFTISGMDKFELENLLVRDMISLPKGQTFGANNTSVLLDRYSHRLSISQGLIYFGIASISSNQFFYRNKTSVPVFDRAYLYESVSNLFLNIIPSRINLQINHRLYGNRIENYTVNINDFLSYFDEAYTIYFGWQSRDTENLIASVFIYNNVFNYSHLLTVKFVSEDVFNEEGVIEATLYSFTPHGNIKPNL
jgi:hypothetical protein